ncbi:VOC family protein [Chengkuizengella axinellae]|uniref:VOC family protein n=1 Tax=Chengkuizengella axinellae TaxID=3064388 RepID=A0ABT9J543_9BACL|nr:VOC family protein [Chengkuizengella sp. 2205SS18-9]MDP5276725.1 VOC family protein [Chengkuizengella sp. 2205SS18-9]
MSLQLSPYLVMNGDGREAIQFYEKALDAEILFNQSLGEMCENSDYPIPAEAKEFVGYASLKIGDSILRVSDSHPGQPHQVGNQVTICISTDDEEKTQRIFEALQDNGQVKMPIQQTPISPSYGIVTDKFGVTFQIYTKINL